MMGGQETQVLSHTLDLASIWAPHYLYCFYAHVFFYINLNLYFLDSTPVNGNSEQKTDDMEVEDKPKSPAQEEDDNTASSPNR